MMCLKVRSVMLNDIFYQLKIFYFLFFVNKTLVLTITKI